MKLGEALGASLSGGQVIELVADLGGGKTTFTQGLVKGLGSKDIVSSPTFTLKKVYQSGKLRIFHYDFYRLSEPGILRDELSESIGDKNAITIIEWADIVSGVLPTDRITIELKPTANDPDEREVIIRYPEQFGEVIRKLETERQEVEP